ncbi:MAG: CapA family protein [Rikenellaceae bacterium]|nr:CapA family protein [Rikenellaceae bacterium]
MIFVGDIALPFPNSISIDGMPAYMEKLKWFGNLEGALPESSDYKKGVFNNSRAVENLKNTYNFAGFALANNHILDIGSLKETLHTLKCWEIPYCGAGMNFNEAIQPVELYESDQRIIIINLGWEVIQCCIAGTNKPGVAPLTKQLALKLLSKNRKKHPDAKILFFMHWSYELESLPQPYERALAHRLINEGADGIIGSHPHRIGEIELYQSKPIVYSLGNWLFTPHYFFDRKLSFPEFCNEELALEWNFESGKSYMHKFEFMPQKSILKYVSTEEFSDNYVQKQSNIQGLSNKPYKNYYLRSHYHKRKGLPIYFEDDSEGLIKIKNRINKLRDIGIKFLSTLR